jgi:hypothetical protein
MKVEQAYTRKGHIIHDMAGAVMFEGYVGSGDDRRPSINAAKRESRKLQAGQLGQGLLRVAH